MPLRIRDASNRESFIYGEEEGCGFMRAENRAGRSRQFAIYAVAILIVVVVLGASIGLMSFIDNKLKKSAEQQVVTFTQQAAANVTARTSVVQKAWDSFEVQSSDPMAIVPALKTLQSNFDFPFVAFAGMDGVGLDSKGNAFKITDLPQMETALARQEESYSKTFQLPDGQRVRLAQRPLYINGAQVGALYAYMPLSLFSMPEQLDMFDGRGYFLLFQRATGEILVAPADETKTPVTSDMSLYSFLAEASLYRLPDGSDATSGFSSEESRQPDTSELSALEETVASGQTGLAIGPVDGKDSYVCVAPVGSGVWYVCNVIPVENVRAEASIVMTAFQVIFAIVILCFVSVIVLTFSSYQKRVRERSVAMKSRLYKALSDSLDMAVNLYCPADGVVTPIVAKSSSILGYSMQELMDNAHIPDKLKLSDEGRELLEQLRAGNVDDLTQGEFSFTHAQTKRVCWIAYSANPLVYEGQRRILVVFRDVTTEKELQLSMKDAMTAAEAANRAKSEFLSRMSHEIRTPMNAIIGMLQIAQRRTDDPEKTSESLKKIGTASDHLLNLINDVLDISKIESGKMVLTSEPFRLLSLIDHVEQVMRPQCEQKGQLLEIIIAPQADKVFVGDAVRLRQLLINLMTNSVKYTPRSGHIKLDVSVQADRVSPYRCITFIVSDDGIGMTEEFKEHLFEPFMMEGRSNVQGTGLGMSIVKNIVTMMGGDIRVDTKLDEGTTFTVVVNLRIAGAEECYDLEESERAGEAWEHAFDPSGRPLDQVAVEGSGVTLDSIATLSGAAFVEKGPAAEGDSLHQSAMTEPMLSLQGAQVLLAEDNELNAEIACELLRDVGLEVEWAENGEIARDMFNKSPLGYYDVVLMDVQMPVMDGYEATRQIRALERADAREVPIIAMSANAFAEDVHASLDSGMNEHLSKPIDMRRVLQSIAKHLKRRREHDGI